MIDYNDEAIDNDEDKLKAKLLDIKNDFDDHES